MIKTGSISRLHDYEKCPRLAEFRYDKKYPEPVQADSPLERGSKIHEQAEQYIRGELQELPEELSAGADLLEHLNTLWVHRRERIELEQMWMYDKDWKPVADDDWYNGWWRAKLDVFVWMDDDRSEAVAIDWKTGKKTGNEVKHMDQMRAYALSAFLRYPELETIHTELHYFDVRESSEATFTRKDLPSLLKTFNERMIAMTTDKEFMPKPSIYHCSWCPFKTGKMGKKGPEGTGDCDLNP